MNPLTVPPLSLQPFSRQFRLCNFLLGFAFCLILTPPQQLHAQTLYIKPATEIPVRRGQGTDYKIIAVVEDGKAVELIEYSGDWAKVHLGNNKEGWLLKRYLSNQPPLDKQVQNLTIEKETLTEKTAVLEKQFTELTEVHGQTEHNLSECIAERTDIRDQFEELKSDTADVQLTKHSLAEARSEISELQEELSRLQIENSVLKKNETIIWFMAGAGVLLIGWLLGRFTKSTKKRRSSLLS
ncbi:TIGR04211 family SH3 domain-containing protein [Desulfogranum japonicum]|uniref:TIGR04211 family SH3 domain-containing protein n=1 Tax=Desulfogranum japonicum TaxID=231447 RepID=UPI0004011DDA|nr:TIGR04211 family SH3 domain-containing protein [Desulfogranum japonicum]